MIRKIVLADLISKKLVGCKIVLYYTDKFPFVYYTTKNVLFPKTRKKTIWCEVIGEIIGFKAESIDYEGDWMAIDVKIGDVTTSVSIGSITDELILK